MSSEQVPAGADGEKEQDPARDSRVCPISSALVPAPSGTETSGATSDQRSGIGHPSEQPSEGSQVHEAIPVAGGGSSGSSGSLTPERLLAKVFGAAAIRATVVAAGPPTASTVEANQEDRCQRFRASAKGSVKLHEGVADTAAGGGSSSSSKGSASSTRTTTSDVKTDVTTTSGTVSAAVSVAETVPPTLGLTASVGTTGTSKEGHSTPSVSPPVLAKSQENEAAGGQPASAPAGAAVFLAASPTNIVAAGKPVARKMSRSCRLAVPSIRAATPAFTLSAQRSAALAQARHNLAQRQRTLVTRAPTTPSSWQATVCYTVLVSGALVSFMVFMQRSLASADVERGVFCKSMDCIQHRRMLRDQLDRNVDPCEDFSAFVCNRWRPSPPFANVSRSTLTDMLLAWLSGMRKLISRGMLYLPVGRKAATMFRSCLMQTQPHLKQKDATFTEEVTANTSTEAAETLVTGAPTSQGNAPGVRVEEDPVTTDVTMSSASSLASKRLHEDGKDGHATDQIATDEPPVKTTPIRRATLKFTPKIPLEPRPERKPPAPPAT
ncbi:hypothetical protein HPB49_002672 [Dermacentor silvarum]|uniref:Uncharacterized protein n=1 Tax=Dermacentor silvarum TaxID=543639 RepID=A0ACB8DTF9_DERSI|nr:hypothetical protein HPB49_002672 [Dermacentor silvarum]